MTARYETIVVTRSDLDDEVRKTLIQKFEALIKKNKGKVEFSQDWGKQRLAYEVKKQQKGTYHYLGYEGDGPLVLTLERSLQIDEAVVLYKTHRVEGEFDANLFLAERIRPGYVPGRRPRMDYPMGGPMGGPMGREGALADEPAKEEIDSEEEV